MVRKKRKGVVKEAETGSGGGGKPPVDLRAAEASVPQDVALSFELTRADFPMETTADVRTLAEWFALLCSARSLFDQLKILQLFRSKCKTLVAPVEDASDSETFVSATWQLIFRLYVAPQAWPLRKNFFLILDALKPASSAEVPSSLEKVAGAEMQRFLGQLLASGSSTADQIVAIFDSTLLVVEFPFLAQLLVSDIMEVSAGPGLPEVVGFCAKQLAVLAEPVTRYQQKDESEQSNDDSSTSVVLVASERCGHALKNIILLTTMKDKLYERVRAMDAALSASGSSTLVGHFSEIAEVCARILQTSVVHKDLLTQAALAYALVLRLLLSVEPSDVANDGRISDQFSVPRQLLRTVYSGHDSSATTPTALQSRIEADASGFGDLSRLAVFRGVLNSLADDELVSSISSDASNKTLTVLDSLFTSAMESCQHESLNVRLYAFQVLEAYLRRAVLIMQAQVKNEGVTPKQIAISFDTLVGLTTVVLLNWEHPSKKVNQFVPPMFTHIVNYFVLAGAFDDWKGAIVARLIALPPHSRAKYGALSILVNKYGVKALLHEYPSLMKSVLIAVGHIDVSAAAANLFSQFLDGSQADDADANRLLLADIVELLVSDNTTLRMRIATYVMPLLLKKNPHFVILLIDQLRSTIENDSAVDFDTALWVIIEVVKYARKRIAPEKLNGLSMAEVQQGLRHGRVETRSSAFDAICASLKSTYAPTLEELLLIKTFLVMSSKEIPSGCRLNTMIGLKNVFFRVKETLRLARKSSAQADNEAVGLAVEFQDWVQQFVITSLYAGSSPQRTILGLEVMLLYLQVFGFESANDSGCKFLSAQVVSLLLNVLVSSWDVVRSLVYTILDLYPSDLPGYASSKELTDLVKWSLALCVSPRQRESDSGALFMRILFRKCALIQRFDVQFEEIADPDISNVTDSGVAFILKLTSVILRRLGACEQGGSRHIEAPMVHGLLLSLRYIIESIDFEQIVSSGDRSLLSEWQLGLKQVFRCVQLSMHASLYVVGDATSGVGDEELSVSFAGVVGEVSSVSTSTASALKVDCRGHLIIEDQEDGEEEGDSAQRAVVGSWLAARECGAITDSLLKRVPLPHSGEASTNLITTEMAQRGGEMLLNSLFELKHKGAVATAYQSFEGVCRSFLAHAEHNSVIGNLPRLWADQLLDRLEKSEQVFILRRSSGFAFSFVAILRAEPRNSAAVILPVVMSNLLRLAAQDTDAIAATQSHEDHHLLWRSRVHALNILKLISQDAVLADDVSVYLARLLEIAIFGFDCESWAVRNSAMMLFAAATQRAIGDKRIADGASDRKVSSADVFSRFPQLSEFLHRELLCFTSHSEQPTDALYARGTTPPGLFPVLMFLSRLRSGEEDDAHNLPEGVSLSDMVPTVLRCASQPTMAIRQMAAKVLAAIVRDSDAARVLAALCADLPTGVRSTKSDSSGSRGPPKTTNYVHGVLAQIHQLVRRFLAGRANGDETSDDIDPTACVVFEFVVKDLLPQMMWLLRNREVCAVIRAELLLIVDVFVEFCNERGRTLLQKSSAIGPQVRALIKDVWVLTADDLQAICTVSGTASQGDRSTNQHSPGMYVVDRTLVSIYFGAWRFEVESGSLMMELTDLPPLILPMLQSDVLQVRKKSVKKLSNLVAPLDGGDKSKGAIIKLSVERATDLNSVLGTQLQDETHPKIKRRLLQLLVHFQKESKSIGKDVDDSFLAKVTSILQTSADANVAAPALELLSLLLHDGSSKVSFGLLRDQIRLRSDTKQPLVLRRSAAKALQNVFALERFGGDEIAIDCWLAVLQLLQDDDTDTRRLANAAAVKGFSGTATWTEYTSMLHAHAYSSLSDALVLPLAIKHFVSEFGHSQYGSTKLATMLLELIDAPAELKQYLPRATGESDANNLSTRIFEAESDNYFAEGELVAQNLVFQMFCQRREDAISRPRLQEQVLETATESLTLLKQALAAHDEWLGGVSYFPGVFSSLQNSLMAAAAVVAVNPREAKAESVCQLAKDVLSAALSRLHPLIEQTLKVLAADGSSVADLLFFTPYWSSIQA